ncbi:MAG TPA: hypothetical protein VHV50_08270 [Actinomycetota bacterium]|jgi:hypothetical protein|nr:hypothetical protein [Actinomycetota bacterium]
MPTYPILENLGVFESVARAQEPGRRALWAAAAAVPTSATTGPASGVPA